MGDDNVVVQTDAIALFQYLGDGDTPICGGSGQIVLPFAGDTGAGVARSHEAPSTMRGKGHHVTSSLQ
ncbi:UNVERIFIED_CONTAM: hypothetical protein Sradi_3631400 [Sesamum radiatum]|uniref:Uncharacterized protein n=1 Tax=Sesamum radiatum TaxID=300843 RepID=A0AAW2QHR6_SESRA